MAFLWRPKGQQLFDNSGNPLNGGKFRYFDAQTTSSRTVYQDSGATVPWDANDITLDSSGRLTQSVYVGAGPFKESLEASTGVVLYTEDNIPGEVVLSTSSFSRPTMPVLSKSISYTVLADDIGSMIQADATGGDVTITLISAVAAGNGAMIGVQNVGTTGRVIVAVPGGQTVNGASTVTMLRPRSGGVFTSNGGAWSGPVTDQPLATLSKTTTYTVAIEDAGKTIKASASGGAYSITLPAVATAGDGFEITVVKTDSTANVVTLDGSGSETINGAATLALGYQWRSATVRCDGSNWQIVQDSTLLVTSSVDNTVPRFDLGGGALQASTVVINDDGSIVQTSTGATTIPVGTTAQRPTASGGKVRLNTDSSATPVTEVYNGSAWRVLDRPLLHIQEQQATNINGGTFTSGAWRTRTLNTEVTDEIGSTLSSNRFTLPAGTYEIIAKASAGDVDQHMAKLANITDGTDALIGSAEKSFGAELMTSSWVRGRFTIAAQKTFELQHWCTSTKSNTGFGFGLNLSVINVFADVMIWRIS